MVVNCVFICSSQNQPKLVKMIGHFRDWSVGQNGFPVGHVRCPALISTTVADACCPMQNIHTKYGLYTKELQSNPTNFASVIGPLQSGTQVNFRWPCDDNNQTAENSFSAPWYYSEMELEPVAG